MFSESTCHVSSSAKNICIEPASVFYILEPNWTRRSPYLILDGPLLEGQCLYINLWTGPPRIEQWAAGKRFLCAMPSPVSQSKVCFLKLLIIAYFIHLLAVTIVYRLVHLFSSQSVKRNPVHMWLLQPVVF